MSKPDRSDPHLPPEEEAKREAEVREYFEGTAPKRHAKPSRSEYSAVYSDESGDQDSIPELDRFQDLQADPEKLVCVGSEVVEEYVETEYYKDLNCIDKEHHTTGSGFIKVEQSNGGIHLTSVADSSGCHESCKGNPATNEWIPSADTVIPVSTKPNRSDS